MKKDLALITGYQLQKNHFAEIGVGIINDGVAGHQPIAVIYGISNEFKLDKHEDLIWGLKMGFWLNGGYSMGVNIINYTDFNSSTLRFRPEIGIGVSIFRIVYGYNFAITNKEFMGINTHNFTINLLLKVKTIKEK